MRFDLSASIKHACTPLLSKVSRDSAVEATASNAMSEMSYEAILRLTTLNCAAGGNLLSKGWQRWAAVGICEYGALLQRADSAWRNRSEFLVGREAIVNFLRRKWEKELDYRLIKELWAFHGPRIAVRFAYEWHDDLGNVPILRQRELGVRRQWPHASMHRQHQ